MTLSTYDISGKRIWIAGHNGMVGRALVRRLKNEDNVDILTVNREDLDLTCQDDVKQWISKSQPDAIVIAAAKVGGIYANQQYPAEFLYQNLVLETNIIHAAYESNVERLVFLGSSCIYPRDADQPISEDALLTGPLEATNEWYAIAKIAGLKLCQAYRKQYGLDYVSVMPTNLYGPYDNFDLTTAHVIPALLHKVHIAKTTGATEIQVWGSGRPRREFLHVDDCADAIALILTSYSGAEPVNIGTGTDCTIAELAEHIMQAADYSGAVRFDPEKPDGTPRKLLDIHKLRALGWKPSLSLSSGLSQTYAWCLRNHVF